jgi:UDP-N-acetylglucosamine--N-acetylmuramyl-(pentapeptide) pyrophosphoryl-undecaprenol N-acetylglucosamine transferase
VVPALAVAQELRAEGAEVAFIGGARAEAELVPAAGYALYAINVEGLSRSNPLHAVRALARAAVAAPRARRLLRSLQADAVLGGGGYVAAPVVLAARTLRVPVVLTEADAVIGLSNRLLAPLARSVCVAFDAAIARRPPRGRAPARWPRRGQRPQAHARSRYVVTGRPLLGYSSDRASARERLGVAAQETLLLVFGGSLGARSINLAALDAFADASFRVLHVCGRRDHAELAARRRRQGYELLAQLDPALFADALAAADLAVARAGGSVLEIAAHALPMILVPYPHAASDHQRVNARVMAEAGAAVVIEDAQLTAPRLSSEVAALLADRPRLAAMAAAARAVAHPDAARRVASELLAAAGAGAPSAAAQRAGALLGQGER